MSKSKENVNNLLAAIQRKTATAKQAPDIAPGRAASPVTEKIEAHEPVERTPKRAPKKPQQRSGGPVNIWMQDDDRKLVRELSAWLAGQGMRTTDSMVIRAALRAAKTGGVFLEACREVAKADGRLKENQ